MPASVMTAHLGVEPDKITVRGSRRLDPPLPVEHTWRLVCSHSGMTIDDQAERVLDRVEPVASKVTELVDTGEVYAVLGFVRMFDDEDGEEEVLDVTFTPEGLELEKLPGQHQLLGWALSPERIQLLASMKAMISAGEYG